MSNRQRSRDRTQLTPKEQEVVDLQEQGLSYSKIGKRLGITRGTVAAHILSARSRMKAKKYQEEQNEGVNE